MSLVCAELEHLFFSTFYKKKIKNFSAPAVTQPYKSLHLQQTGLLVGPVTDELIKVEETEK